MTPEEAVNLARTWYGDEDVVIEQDADVRYVEDTQLGTAWVQAWVRVQDDKC